MTCDMRYMTDKDIHEKTETNRDSQGQTGTRRDRQGPTGTDRDKERQIKQKLNRDIQE